MLQVPIRFSSGSQDNGELYYKGLMEKSSCVPTGGATVYRCRCHPEDWHRRYAGGSATTVSEIPATESSPRTETWLRNSSALWVVLGLLKSNISISFSLCLMSRMTNTGQGVERTTWLPSGREMPGGWRKTRLPSAPRSWRRRTPPSAKRWPTYGKSWANARTCWRSTRLGTAPCKRRVAIFFFHLLLFLLWVGICLDGQCVSCLIAPRPSHPFCHQHFTRSRNKTDVHYFSFACARACVCMCARMCRCVRAHECVRISALPISMKPFSKGATFLPGLLRTAIVSFLLYFLFLSPPVLLQIRNFMLL